MEVSPRTEMKVDSEAVLGVPNQMSENNSALTLLCMQIVRRLSLDTEPCVLKRTDSMCVS